MKKYFTIGETARLNGISIKALRHYDSIELLKPAYIDNDNNYRYYTYDQFPYIDKIKRYQSIGMPLKNIKEFFDSQDNNKIECFLESQNIKLQEEYEKLNQRKNNLEWLTSFFEESKKIQIDGSISIRQEKERFVIFSENECNSDIMAIDMQLRQTLAHNELENLTILNPYGYILNIDDFLKGKITFTHAYVSIASNLNCELDCIMKFPEAEYTCFHAPILSNDIDLSSFLEHLNSKPSKPKLIIANEYIKKFYDPLSSPYEIQILY